MFPRDRLERAARCFAAALRPKGVLVIEPWIAPGGFTPGHPALTTYDGDDIKIARASVSRRNGDMSIIDFHWVVARRNADRVEHFSEQHEMWLCSRRELCEVLESAGFDCRDEEDQTGQGERSWVIAVRRE